MSILPIQGLGVEVYGENELVARLMTGEAHYRACISIGNPRPLLRAPSPGEALHPLIKGSFDRILRLSFYDLEEVVELPDRTRLSRIPSHRDALRVLRFYEATKGQTDGWTVHCWAGISRSTAVALALLYRITGDEAEAARRLVAIRPEAMPNHRLVRAFDALLGSNLSGVLEAVYRDRQDALREELDRELEELDEAPEEPSGDGRA